MLKLAANTMPRFGVKVESLLLDALPGIPVGALAH